MNTTVSIIIPVHNCLTLTEACLASVEKYTPKGETEILIVDDASESEVSQALLTKATELTKSGLPTKVLKNKNRESRTCFGGFRAE